MWYVNKLPGNSSSSSAAVVAGLPKSPPITKCHNILKMGTNNLDLDYRNVSFIDQARHMQINSTQSATNLSLRIHF